jgi:hypothetical protein
VCAKHTASGRVEPPAARIGKETFMQRLFGRFAAHFLGSAALHSDPVTPAAASGPPAIQRNAHSLARLVDRWESSPDLLGEEKTQDALVIAFFGAFSLIGWLMVVQGCEQLRQAHATERWPTAEGTVMAVDVQAVGSGEGARWRPQVIYAYSVGDRVITATRIAQGNAPNINDEARARAYVRNYMPQANVTVHYNPAQITESVLEPATPRSAYLNLLLGAFLASLGLVLFMLFAVPASRRRGWLFWRRPWPSVG